MAIDTDLGRRLAVGLVRTFKLFGALKSAMPAPGPGLEHGSLPVLFAVRAEPARVTAIAERVHSDVSVVSRQVTSLQGAGFLVKSPDPDDRRASVVALTERGSELLESVVRDRAEWISGLLADWTPEEAEDLDRHLRRLVAALEAELARGPAPGPAARPTDIRPESSEENR